MDINGAQECLANRQILVTGATGFIGSHLVERLVALGAHVRAIGPTLGWRPVVSSLARQGKVRFVKLGAFWNPASVGRVLAELQGVEYVVHLGYAVPQGKSLLEKAAGDVRQNVLGTLAFIKRLPPSVSKVCFASSVMVYGCNPPQPVSETDFACPATIYATGKLATETYLRACEKEIGFAVSILRYATVYGPMETVPRAIPNFIRKVLAGKPPIIRGDGEEVRDYVHVLDAVDATLLALAQEGRGQVYNVGTGKGHTTNEIAERFIQLAGRPLKPIHEPANQRSYKLVCDISHARNVLGYEPRVKLDDGLVDELQYYASNPHLWRVL